MQKKRGLKIRPKNYTPTQRHNLRRFRDYKKLRKDARKSYLYLDNKLGTILTKKQRKQVIIKKEKAYKRYQDYDIKIKALKVKCKEMGIKDD